MIRLLGAVQKRAFRRRRVEQQPPTNTQTWHAAGQRLGP
jgi:hypothetical protein